MEKIEYKSQAGSENLQSCFRHLALAQNSANAGHIRTKAGKTHIWTCYDLIWNNQFAFGSCDFVIPESHKLMLCSYFKILINSKQREW